MKRIRNQRDLHEAKMNLELRELRLEKELRNDWEQFRGMIHLNGSKRGIHTGDEHWLIAGLHTAASSLSKRILEKAETKIEEGADKAISYMGKRVSQLFGRNAK